MHTVSTHSINAKRCSCCTIIQLQFGRVPADRRVYLYSKGNGLKMKDHRAKAGEGGGSWARSHCKPPCNYLSKNSGERGWS